MNEISKKLEEILIQSNNKFDKSVDQLIKELKLNREDQYGDLNYWIELENSKPEEYEEFQEFANRYGHSLNSQMKGNFENALDIEDELSALLEMKIIYAFKHLEINIKKLLFYAYNELPNKKPKWHEMEEFLKKKGIKFKDISDYSEVNELRLVNNSLKHSHQNVDQSIISIEEFKNGSIENFETLENFYARIEHSPTLFFCDLLENIEKEINNFNKEKICSIAKKATNKMNKEIAEKLIFEIRNIYK